MRILSLEEMEFVAGGKGKPASWCPPKGKGNGKGSGHAKSSHKTSHSKSSHQASGNGHSMSGGSGGGVICP